MIMCRHTPAHYVLVPVHEGMPSLAELAVALVEVGPGEVIEGVDSDIPSFEGPGWMAQVVFDV